MDALNADRFSFSAMLPAAYILLLSFIIAVDPNIEAKKTIARKIA